jgi:peptidoglycan/xylan/chitin deacetylase (PgdA/CDA1 family)
VVEAQFRFLAEHEYRTLTADELELRLRDPGSAGAAREVALTFDDALGSVYSVAFPLARRYGIRFTVFALPGLTPEGSPGPTLDAPSEELREQARGRDQSASPLCSWGELEAMHESGCVDVQSHGLVHARVAVAPRIVDFIRPGFDLGWADFHVPLYRGARGEGLRAPVLGHPVYESDSLLAGRPRFLDDAEVREESARYVERHGGADFFSRRGWRRELLRVAERCRPESRARFEERSVTLARVAAELADSRRLLEARLPGKRVRHFCFPWFRASAGTAALARAAGYETIHLGATAGFRARPGASTPLVVTRRQQEYLRALPGTGGRGLWSVLAEKLTARTAAAG